MASVASQPQPSGSTSLGGEAQEGAGPAGAAAAASPPSLFDPTHLPTLLPRILSIRNLLNDATASSDALVQHVASGAGAGAAGAGPSSSPAAENGLSNGGAAPTTTTSTTQVPSTATVVSDPFTSSLTLGATSDEDDTFSNLFSSLPSSSSISSIAPTALHNTLVAEARELREAFAKAQRSIEGLEGGELSIREQEEVIRTLEGYVEGIREGNVEMQRRIAGATIRGDRAERV